MRDVWPEIRASGAHLAVVGNGQVFHAQDFQAHENLPFPLYVDPHLEAYAAAGLRRGVLSTARPRVFVHAARALRQGFRQGKTQGDPWQQGGVFVVTPGGRVLFRYVSREAGDHPSPEAILATLG